MLPLQMMGRIIACTEPSAKVWRLLSGIPCASIISRDMMAVTTDNYVATEERRRGISFLIVVSCLMSVAGACAGPAGGATSTAPTGTLGTEVGQARSDHRAVTPSETIRATAGAELDDAGQATASPEVSLTASPQLLPTAEARAERRTDVSLYETSITLSSYPYESYLRERVDPRYNSRVVWLDRAAYDAASPEPQPRVFKAVVLENRYLRLTFLPELGGRLYMCSFKPTQQDIFYRNSVLKPSYWGPLNREENWWLAMGGMEWALPVHEHGYEWGVPWMYQMEWKESAASITLRDSAADDRLRAEITITLPSERAFFVVQPRLVNPTSEAITCQFWINTVLTLGSASACANTEFIYPTEQMIVHSTGESGLPSERQMMTWPVYGGRDWSLYRNWRNWLGVFVPGAQEEYVGAYNHDTELGLVRVFPPDEVPGLKLFAFGSDFPARGEYSDDGSDYFEMWAGPCRTFWPEDDVSIGPGQSLAWSETWLPFIRVGGIDRAGTEAVVRADVRDGRVRLRVAVSCVRSLQVRLQWNDQTFYAQWEGASPDSPLLIDVPLPSGADLSGQLGVQLRSENGAILLEYRRSVPL